MADDIKNAATPEKGETGAPRLPDLREAGPPVPLGPSVAIRPPRPRPARRLWLILALVVAAAGAAGGAYWWHERGNGLPPGIAWSNGRLEADEIDIATKFAGRVATLMADEGDTVKAGQVLARMDTKDLEASLAQAESTVAGAEYSIEANQATLEQERSVLALAAKQLARTRALMAEGFASQELLDQRQSQFSVAMAAYNATLARINTARTVRDAARHNSEVIRANIADNTLVAPKDGRIQYRLANVGEVLPAGGKIFTMLDTGYVYMDVFLPTGEAGRVVVGAEARIVVDALPKLAIPAHVTFVASQSQFTPKTVETKSDRDKLMFRVRVRVDPEFLRAHTDLARSGLPGVAYIRLDPHIAWPAALEGPR